MYGLSTLLVRPRAAPTNGPNPSDAIPVPALTLAHDAVLAVVELLPEGMPASAVLVARAMGISEAAAERLLDELEAAGCLVSAIGRVQ